MKKALAFLISVALLVAPAGCAAEHGQLTLERVEQLAEKGEALTWSDFEGYAYEEAGSGLYIRVYDVNEEYYVMVGGPSLEESPPVRPAGVPGRRGAVCGAAGRRLGGLSARGVNPPGQVATAGCAKAPAVFLRATASFARIQVGRVPGKGPGAALCDKRRMCHDIGREDYPLSQTAGAVPGAAVPAAGCLPPIGFQVGAGGFT